MNAKPQTRREVLVQGGLGFSQLALLGLLGRQAKGAGVSSESASLATHHPAKAKRVLFLFMGGGPSHHDTFDYKPELIRNAGKSAGMGSTLGNKRADGRMTRAF